MAKKSRRKKGNKSDDVADEVDYLSECHTVATLGSVTSNNTGGNDSSLNDDAWEMDDDEFFVEGGGETPAKSQLRQEKFLECLETLHDFPSEKRSTRREAMLKMWFKGLTQYATESQMVEALRDELVQNCCQTHGLKGSPAEQYASCRVLEATAILIGSDEYYESIQVHLRRVIQSSHRAIPVRVAALKALGMAVFIGVDDDVITEDILDLCEALAQTEYRGSTTPLPLRATALDVWTLLATTIHELYVAGKDDVSTGRGLHLFPTLLECLEQEDDLTLRVAAGECVAWIHTARVALGNHDGDATTQKYAPGTWEGSEWEDIVAEIEIVMEELSNQSGHYMSKKAKKEQRANFREYLSTLQDNEAPIHVVQFRGGSLELTSWRDIIALNYTRRCLQGGFQIQLLTNPILQVIFGAHGETLAAHGTYSQLEKRLILSKASEASKAKDMDRSKKRRNRTNAKNHFLTADGDDI